MIACPHCGALLAESLVAAIRDPHRSESCPHMVGLGAPTADEHILAAAAAAIQRRMALSLSALTRPVSPVPAPGGSPAVVLGTQETKARPPG